MPDISMCQNDQCPLRFFCYRFTAQPNQWRQAYADFQFSVDDEGKPHCEAFSNNGTRGKQS